MVGIKGKESKGGKREGKEDKGGKGMERGRGGFSFTFCIAERMLFHYIIS